MSSREDKDETINDPNFVKKAILNVDKHYLKNCLIHNFEERTKSGEIEKLKNIFESRNQSFEMKGVSVDVNLKDDEIDD